MSFFDKYNRTKSLETQFKRTDQSELNSYFSTEKWNSLDLDTKVELCQEIENRYAINNNVSPCEVKATNMYNDYGVCDGNTIHLNREILNNGTITSENELGEYNTYDVHAAGWQTMDTVYHEGTHGIQFEQGRIQSTYINPKWDRNLYRIQGDEKEAFQAGQEKTMEALQNYEARSGVVDSERDYYINSVECDSFEEAQKEAALNYNDENIEDTVNSVIHDRSNGIVNNDPSESYNSINNLIEEHEMQNSNAYSEYQESKSENNLDAIENYDDSNVAEEINEELEQNRETEAEESNESFESDEETEATEETDEESDENQETEAEENEEELESDEETESVEETDEELDKSQETEAEENEEELESDEEAESAEETDEELDESQETEAEENEEELESDEETESAEGTDKELDEDQETEVAENEDSLEADSDVSYEGEVDSVDSSESMSSSSDVGCNSSIDSSSSYSSDGGMDM